MIMSHITLYSVQINCIKYSSIVMFTCYNLRPSFAVQPLYKTIYWHNFGCTGLSNNKAANYNEINRMVQGTGLSNNYEPILIEINLVVQGYLQLCNNLYLDKSDGAGLSNN